MSSRSLQLLVIIVLYHVVAAVKLRHISGSGHEVNSHDNPRHKELVIDLQHSRDSSRSSKNRVRRAATGPVASTPYILDDDYHRYANVRYSGGESDVVFILTYDTGGDNHVISSSLYRSSDYGKTFVSETSKFPGWAKLHPRYHVSEDRQTIVFPDDNNRTIYVSKDEGQSYAYYSIPVDPTSLLFHPTKPQWVLGFDDNEHELQVSMDLGRTWTQVSANVRSPRDYTWGVPGIDWRLNATAKSELSKLYYNTYDPNDVTGDSEVSLMIAQYPFASSSSRVFDPNLGLHDAFLIVDKYIFVQRTVDTTTGEVELLVSYNRGPFKVARIPFEDSHQSYLVGTYRSAQAFVVVQHTGGTDNLYFSDETGTYYSLSLDRIVLDDDRNVLDLELISSMNGTFIANQYTSSGSDTIRTVITFDNGAEWHLLEAPEVTANGIETDCEVPLCSLHLQMYSTDFSRLGVYSRTSAPGIIVAHGNYGSSLSQGVVDLYISRDGGLRWKQILVGSWDVQIIDHGGLLVAAKDYHQQDETYILYSCNEGRSWSNFTFTDTPTVIWGVVTEPGENTTEVALFGSEDRSDPEWAIISINFTGVFQRKCASGDYWHWAVSDGRIANHNCLLGESRVIERRKIEICCLSGEKYERIISATPCECAREDFECDWGYKSDDYNAGKCVVDENFSIMDSNRPGQPCVSGYRKIAGDTCIGGITDDLLNCTPPVNCSINNPTKSSTLNPSTTTSKSITTTSSPTTTTSKSSTTTFNPSTTTSKSITTTPSTTTSKSITTTPSTTTSKSITTTPSTTTITVTPSATTITATTSTTTITATTSTTTITATPSTTTITVTPSTTTITATTSATTITATTSTTTITTTPSTTTITATTSTTTITATTSTTTITATISTTTFNPSTIISSTSNPTKSLTSSSSTTTTSSSSNSATSTTSKTPIPNASLTNKISSNTTTVIVLGILLAIFIVATIILAVIIIVQMRRRSSSDRRRVRYHLAATHDEQVSLGGDDDDDNDDVALLRP